MAAARFYSSVAGPMDLTASIVPSDSAITVSTTTGLPGTTPFTLVLDPGTASEEIVTATNVSGLTITITRGVDGSTATSHAAGVGNVRHMATARDYREPQEHIAASVNVHGIGATGSVVGTDTSQTLTNKTAGAASPTTKALIVKGIAGQTANILDVQSSAGTTLAMVDKDGNLATTALTTHTPAVAGGLGTMRVRASTGFENNGTALEVVSDRAAVAAGPILHGVTVRTTDGTVLGTGKALRVIQHAGSWTGAGTEVASIDEAGKLAASQVTSAGPVSGTTGTFSGAVAASNFSSGVSAKVTSSVGSVVAETILVTAPSVTGDGTKRFQITGDIYGITGSSGDRYELRLKDSTAGTQLKAQMLNVGASGISDGKTITFTDVPPAGPHAYQITAVRSAGAGTGSVFAAATAPIEIIVKQIA